MSGGVTPVEPDMYVWDGQYGKIVSRGIKFVAPEKPEIPAIGDYVYLFYEPATGNLFKTVNVNGTNVDLPLTKEEKNVLSTFCDHFADDQDYNVWPYDENRLYVNEMLKSEAIRDGLEYTLIGAPDHPASKFVPGVDGKADHWEKIKAVIRSDGSLSLDPPALCQLCLLGYTEEEWEKMPHPKSVHDRFDFTTETWKDPRTLEQCKLEAWRSIQQDFDTIVWKTSIGQYTPQYQMDTWPWQVQEAKAILNIVDLDQGELADTSKWSENIKLEMAPYLTTFLDARTDEHKPTFVELARDVLKNHKEYLIASAKGHAKLWDYKKKIEAATTNEECDALIAEVSKFLQETFKPLPQNEQEEAALAQPDRT